MAQDPNALIWIDMEMSGLNPETDRVLEVAIVITDAQLNIITEAPVLVVHQSDAVLDAMDNWNQSTHKKSGLIDRVRASTLTEADVEERMIAFLSQHVASGVSPLCGNLVLQTAEETLVPIDWWRPQPGSRRWGRHQCRRRLENVALGGRKTGRCCCGGDRCGGLGSVRRGLC